MAVTLVAGPGRKAVLLTVRADHLPAQGGQFALPGGRCEPDEDPAATARRELAEELGLRLGAESVIGVLDDFGTRSGYRITPVVLWAGDAPTLAPDPAEVAAVHEVAFVDLLRPGSPDFCRRRIPTGRSSSNIDAWIPRTLTSSRCRTTAKAGVSSHDSMRGFVQQLIMYAVAAVVVASFAGVGWAPWAGLVPSVLMIRIDLLLHPVDHAGAQARHSSTGWRTSCSPGCCSWPRLSSSTRSPSGPGGVVGARHRLT